MNRQYPAVLVGSQGSPHSAAILAPIIVIAVALLVYCLVDLMRRETVAGGNKLVWVAVIIVLGTLGQIAYLTVGRGDS